MTHFLQQGCLWKPLQTVPLTGNRVVKYTNLCGTFLFKLPPILLTLVKTPLVQLQCNPKHLGGQGPYKFLQLPMQNKRKPKTFSSKVLILPVCHTFGKVQKTYIFCPEKELQNMGNKLKCPTCFILRIEISFPKTLRPIS